MAINNLTLEPDGLVVGSTQLVTSGGGVTIGQNLAVAGNIITGNVTSLNGWNGTSSLAGRLGGICLTYNCERVNAGSVGQVMSYGNGASTLKCLRMPFAGKLVLATLSGASISGTITLQAYLNGGTQPSYQLSATSSGGDIGQTIDFSSAPLSFNAGDTLGWYTTVVPSAANGYNVSYFVIFN